MLASNLTACAVDALSVMLARLSYSGTAMVDSVHQIMPLASAPFLAVSCLSCILFSSNVPPFSLVCLDMALSALFSLTSFLCSRSRTTQSHLPVLPAHDQLSLVTLAPSPSHLAPLPLYLAGSVYSIVSCSSHLSYLDSLRPRPFPLTSCIHIWAILLRLSIPPHLSFVRSASSPYLF